MWMRPVRTAIVVAAALGTALVAQGCSQDGGVGQRRETGAPVGDGAADLDASATEAGVPVDDLAAPPEDASGEDAERSDTGDAVDGGTADARPRCAITPDPEPFRAPERKLQWRAPAGVADGGIPFPGSEQVCSTPVVADIVPEPPGAPLVPEIAFLTFDCGTGYRNAVLRVISGRAPHRLHWSQNGFGAPNDPRAPNNLRWDGHVAAADLDGDRTNGLEIVAVTVNTAGNIDGLVAYRANGSVYWRTSGTGGVAGFNAANPSVNIADLEGDEVPEVIVGASVFHGRTGAFRWTGTGTRGVNSQGPLSIVADLDNDGRLEVIAGGTVYEADGRLRFNQGDGFAAVGDVLDALNRGGRDGIAEVVRVTAGRMDVLDRMDGHVRWTAAIDGGGAGGAPTIADFDGDGHAEIGVAGAVRYVLFDPDCTGMSAECAGVGVRWAAVTEDQSSAVTSSTVFDFNGDGASEVVYNDEERFQVLDGRTGRVVYFNWNPSQTRTEQAIVADADGDRQADIVFGANQCANFAGDKIPAALQATERVPGLEVWSSSDGAWVGARRIWNEHGFHLDNISEDGVLPRPEPAGWLTHNTFRLNVARDRTFAAPDFTPGASDVTCNGGRMTLCVEIRNEGDDTGGFVRIAAYDRDPATPGAVQLGSAESPRVVDAHDALRVCVELPAVHSPTQFWIRIDDRAAVRECNETNNVRVYTADCGPG